MQLRTVLFCSFALVPTLAACGDDSGGGGGSGGGGDSSTTGATGSPSSTGTPSSSTSDSSASTGDTSTSDASTSTDTSSSTGTGTPELSCQTYCANLGERCTGGETQFPDTTSCLASCAAYPEGAYMDADESLGCHQYHSDAAASDPVTHCSHAGPSGGGQCGTGCQNFCNIAASVCSDVYPSVDVCMKTCGDFEPGEFSVEPPATGDTLGCRTYHLTVAATSAANAVTHCPHTAAVSDQCF